MEGLRGHTSGYAIPTYVIDAPGGGGKIPVMPNYLISYSDHKVVLRNYEGYITTYEEPLDYKQHDKSRCTSCQHGAAGARPVGRATACCRASGCGSSRRTSQRSTRAATSSRTASSSRASGRPTASARSRAQTRAGAAGARRRRGDQRRRQRRPAAADYAPGEEPRPREGEPTGSAHGELL